jgi:enterochelin esterase-like enzyme
MARKLRKITFNIARRDNLVKGFALLLLLMILAACSLSSEPASSGDTSPSEQLSDSTTAVTPEPPPTTAIEPEALPVIGPTWTTSPPASPIPSLEPTLIPLPSLTPTPVGCQTPGQVITGTYPSQIAGPTRNYRVYLPPCFGQENRVYPTIYLFHGNTHTDTAWDDLGLDETAEAAIQAGEIPPVIIALPDGGYLANNTSGGPNSFEGVMLNEFIPFIEETYCGWPEPAGRAIGGLSRGGYWALEIAFRFPEQFISVGGHSAALYDTAAGPELNPQFTGLTNDLGDLRIYLDIGENDYLIPNIQRLHEDMVAEGRPHIWVLNEGFHEDAYWATHGKEYLEWYTEPWPLDPTAYPRCR